MVYNLVSSLNNREISILVWTLVLIVWAMSVRGVRTSLGAILRSLTRGKVLGPLVLMAAYVACIVVTLHALGLWESSQLKITIVWYITALSIFFKAATNENFSFKDAALENFKIAVLLEFFVNLYVLSLPLELILIPLATLIGLMETVSSLKPDLALATRPLRSLSAIIGVGMLVFVYFRIQQHPGEFISSKTASELLMPIVLSLLFLPFVYGLAVFLRYETLFFRLRFQLADKELEGYAKSRLIWTCNLNLYALLLFGKNLHRLDFGSKESIDKSVRELRRSVPSNRADLLHSIRPQG